MIHERKNIWKYKIRIHSVKLFHGFINIISKAVKDGVFPNPADSRLN